MATEKKTTAQKAATKKATAKKPVAKKAAKAVVKHIGLVKNDPYLADYEDAIKGRHDHACPGSAGQGSGRRQGSLPSPFPHFSGCCNAGRSITCSWPSRMPPLWVFWKREVLSMGPKRLVLTLAIRN